MKHFTRTTLIVAALALMVTACNTAYNFDNISLEVTVGNTEGITIPLGSTKQITVASLLGEESGLQTDENGFYSFSMADSFSESVALGTLAPITGLSPEIAPTTITMMGEVKASIPQINETQTLPYPEGISSGLTIPAFLVGQTFSHTYGPAVFEERYEIMLPEQIESVDKVTFGADGNGSEVSITFHLAGLEPVSEKRVMNHFTIEAPAGFELQAVEGDPLASYVTISKGEGSTTNNHYEVRNMPLEGEQVAMRFRLMSLLVGEEGIENGVLNINDDITYSYDMDYTVKAGTTGSTAPSVIAKADIALHEATITLAAINESVAIEHNLSQTIDLPKEVSEIHSLSVSRTDLATAMPNLSVSLDMSGSPIAELSLSTLSLEIPALLDVEAPEGWTKSGNVLSTTNVVLKNDASNPIVTIPLKGLKDIPVENSQAKIDGKVAVNATLALAAGSQLTVDSSAKVITIAPKVTIDDMRVHSLVGKVNPDLSGIVEPMEIDMSELTAALGDAEIDLNLNSPVVTFKVENPIGVGINMDVSIDAYKNDKVTATATAAVAIKGAEGSTPAVTEVVLTGDTPAEGQTKVEGLMDIISSLPDKLLVSVNLAADQSKPHSLVLKDSYTFKVDYSVAASLTFNEEHNGRLHYTTVIEDVDLSGVGDIEGLTIDTLTLNVAAQSTLPLDALLEVEFLDEQGAELSDIKAVTTGTIAGSTTAEAKESNISIGLTLGASAESSKLSPLALLGKVKAVKCTFDGKTLAGGGLKPDQWLQATLSVCINEGVTVDLEELLKQPDEAPKPDEEAQE